MTAFFGVFHFDQTPVDQPTLALMMRRIAYRGQPQRLIVDEGASYGIGAVVNRVTFESRDEVQPLTRHAVTLTAVAYLTERAALLDKLKAAGCQFDDPHGRADYIPDSELILNAYLTWDTRCVEHLRGDFAFMIWDARRQQLFCARDYFATRVLYYAEVRHPDHGRVLVVSTELIAIRLHPLVSSELDQQSVGDFLVSGSAIWIDKFKTSYTAIRQLEAKHTLLADRTGLQTQQYWEMPIQTSMLKYKTERDYVEHYRSLLTLIIRERMRSDKIVISMSGGLDSTTIAVLAADIIARGEVNAELRILCAIYERIMPDTEVYYAGLVARKFKLAIEYVPQDQFRIPNPLPMGVHLSQGYPGGAVEMSKLVSERGKLMLTGDGSDEMLLLTPLWDVLHSMPVHEAASLYLWMWQFQKRRPPLIGLLPYLRMRFDPREHALRKKYNERARIRYPVWLNPDFEREYRLRERLDSMMNWQPGKTTPMLQPEAYKRLEQYASANVGEMPTRHEFTPSFVMLPFMDLRLIEFALSLPPQPFNNEKYILRQAMRGTLPDEVVDRPKTPLGALIPSLLSQPDMEWVDEWEAVPELSRYVIRERVPRLIGVDLSKIFSQVQLRPLSLNQWLQRYQGLLEEERQALSSETD
ncbi:MAG: asparagine synthase-related protein [Chloroflexota bacterium]|nr:asparagine synthase-related protein [Chloroflexota bacterium]